MSARIYWVNQYAITPDQPGGSRHFDLGSELARRGHDVTVVASDLNLGTRRYARRPGPSERRVIEEKVGDVRFAWLTAGEYRANDWRRLASMLVFAWAALRYLVARPMPDDTVVIGSTPHLFAALAAWGAARLRRRPFVLEVRDLWPESYEAVSGVSGGLLVKGMRLIADLLYRHADAIIVLAEPNRDVIAARGVDPELIVYVPNGVDVAAVDTAAAAATDLGAEGCTTFVYAGAHGPANGLDVVVDACRLLAERGRADVRAALLGDGTEKEALQASAQALGIRNVLFAAPVPKSAVHATLATAEGGLMILAPVELFSYGVSPNKLFDYMAAGLPVVTNVPGLVASIVEESGSGVVAAPGDPVALADAMEAMADRDRTPLANAGRRYVEDNYDRRVLAHRVERVIEALVRTQAPRSA